MIRRIIFTFGFSRGSNLGTVAFESTLFHKDNEKGGIKRYRLILMVGEGGFEPPKSLTTDLQSAPFGHSGTLPYYGAGGRTRTPDLLITNQLLYQLSYTSTFSCSNIIPYRIGFVNSFYQNPIFVLK